LTERELEILCLVADGLSNKQIARRLCLSLYTVKNHVHNVLQKLQVGDRYQAVAQLREQGWIAKKAV
jgi:DNA-binding NarL/FixJ family response regulator